MEEKTMTIGEMAAQMVAEAKRLGFSEATIWRSWMPGVGMVAKYYHEQGLCVYDPVITDNFLKKIEGRYVSEEVSYGYLRQMRQITRRLNEFYLTGTLFCRSDLRLAARFLFRTSSQMVNFLRFFRKLIRTSIPENRFVPFSSAFTFA